MALLAKTVLHDPHSAKTHYLEAVRLNPRYTAAHVNLALLLELPPFADSAKALEHYSHALKTGLSLIITRSPTLFGLFSRSWFPPIDPKCARAHKNIGRLYHIHHGDTTRAKHHYQQAITIDDSYVSAHFRLAELLMKEKDYSAAQHHLQRVVKLDQRNMGAYVHLASLNETGSMSWICCCAVCLGNMLIM